MRMRKGLFLIPIDMAHRYLMIPFLCLLACLACEREEIDGSANGSATTEKVNQWIERTMRDYYLWYDELPGADDLDLSQDPERFFQGLLSDKDGKVINGERHYFSQLERASTTKSFFGEGDSYGFDFAVSDLRAGGDTYKIALVLYVLEGSPAEEAGLRRGDWILGVDGRAGTIQDYDVLRSGSGLTLLLGKITGNGNTLVAGRTLTIAASREVEDTPFLKDTVLDLAGTRLGYLMYNYFSSGPDEYDADDTRYNDELLRLFRQFKERGVREFVLDLRYNSGGLLSSARLLASLLAAESALGEPFCLLKYNDKHTDRDETLSLLTSTETAGANLGLSRLFVLTGSATASSSELVINGLRPYMDVRVIGARTLGKTVGMSIFNGSKEYGWILSPLTFHVYNKNGEADYEDGIRPDAAINEFSYDLEPFGDPADPLLARAIEEIAARSARTRSAAPSTGLDIRRESPRGRKGNAYIINDTKIR